MNRNQIIRCCGHSYQEMTERLLEFADLKNDIFSVTGKKTEDTVIGIKPNLVCASPAEFGATTHPEVVEGIVHYLQIKGFSKIIILEGSWVGDSTEDAFEYCGYRSLADRCGVSLLNTKKDAAVTVNAGDLQISVCSSYFSLDYLINVPVLKGHCQTKMTCALKNMKGLIPDSEKRKFHRLGLHKPIAYLNTVIKQNFIVVDDICPDPDFEEGGNPQQRNCILAAKDPVLVDSYACKELGLKPEEIPYLKLAESLGIGSASGLEEILLQGSDQQSMSSRPRKLLDVSYAVEDSDTCSACYASLTEALWKLEKEGLLEEFPVKIGIGQGNKMKKGKLGVGNCTCHFETSIPGCPPDAETVYQGLKEYLKGI